MRLKHFSRYHLKIGAVCVCRAEIEKWHKSRATDDFFLYFCASTATREEEDFVAVFLLCSSEGKKKNNNARFVSLARSLLCA